MYVYVCMYVCMCLLEYMFMCVYLSDGDAILMAQVCTDCLGVCVCVFVCVRARW